MSQYVTGDGVRLVQIDGKIVPPDRAVVSLFDRGFLYGDSVFEVVRTYGKKAFALDEHMQRLWRSAAAVFIEPPIAIDPFEREIAEAIAASAGDGEFYVRTIFTRGSGALGLDPGLADGKPLRVVIVASLKPPAPTFYDQGITVRTVRMNRAVDGTDAGGAKVSNYLPNLLALREAKMRGDDEALIVDRDQRVTEGATSNLFIVRENAVITPGDDGSILPGITRRVAIEAAKAAGFSVTFGPLYLADVLKADEVFITSTLREVIGVVKVNGSAIGDAKVGPATRAIHASFRALVASTSAS